jgi:phasin family protein
MSTVQTKPAGKARATASVIKAKDSIAHATERQFKAADDIAALGKSNVDALIQAGTSFYRGWEELTRSVVGLTQSQVETSMSAAKALLGAKTLTDFTDLQNAYTKTAFDNAVSEASRLSELAIRIANETVEPLSARLTATIEHLSKPALAA